MGADREREREGKGKRGGADASQAEPAEEAVPCGLCGDSLIEGEVGDREKRGSYHRGCIRKARWELLGEPGPDPVNYLFPRRRRRRS